MSTPHIIILGCLGGLLAYVLTFALPFFRAMYKSDGNVKAKPVKVIGAVGILVCLVAIGGVAAWLLGGDTTTSKDAFWYGVAGEGLLAGVIQSATAV